MVKGFKMKAFYNGVANELFNTRSYRDGRKIVNRLSVSYLTGGRENIEYRKGYEFQLGTSREEMLNQIPHIIEVNG